jgi:pentatricopeptide repeat protein
MYAKCGSLTTADRVFEKLRIRNVVSWNALITGYAEHEQGDKALLCFEKMQKEGVSPNTVTFLCCLKACGNIGALIKGQEIHGEVERRMLIEKDLVVGNSVVDMYAKCGALDKAQDVFGKLPVRDIVSWTTLMAGHAYCGESKTVFCIFEEMQVNGIEPNPVTFVVILNACSRNCLVSKSLTYFEAMSKDYGIVPMVEHHTCMVDLHSRAGNLEKAVDMIGSMSLSSHILMWHTVLGSCRSLGNAKVGKQAFENAVNLDGNDPVAYVLMSQI